MAVDNDEKQHWFEIGQESVDKPLGELGGPSWRPCESDDEFDGREDAFQSGRRSVLNNRN